MASVVFNRGKFRIMSRAAVGTFKALLAQPAYTPNPDQNFVSEVTNELTGGTYTRKTLTGVAYTEDDAADRAIFTSDAVAWSALATVAAGQQAGWLVIFEDMGGADTGNHLIVAHDITDVTTDGNDLTVTPNAAGWLYAA
mgnify:CR=1 FL=1